MKKLILSSLLAIFLFGVGTAQYDDVARSGYEGDFFSLEGALELFKDSRSVSHFERKLNSERSYVNNLDLNLDGKTDYVRVHHRRSGRFHAIIMQAILNRREVQDVAVIEFERTNDYEVLLQIVGDEDLYGERVVIESYDENWGRFGSAGYNNRYVNAYHWPIMQFMFAPHYVTYVSPYSYGFYPNWYSPWNRCTWNVFYPRIVRYRGFYRVAPVYRLTNVYNFYRPYRTFCPSVRRNTGYVRTTRGRNSYYFGSNARTGGRFAGRNSGASTTRGKANVNSHRTNSKRPGNSYSSTRTSPSSRPTVTRKPSRKTPTRTSRPTARPNSSKSPTGYSSKRPTRKPNVITSKPGRSSRTHTSVRKPTTRSSTAKPRGNQSSRKPSVYKRPTSRSNGVSRSSSQVRRPSTSSRSAKPRTAPSRSKASSKPYGSSRPKASSSHSSRSRSSARSSGSSRSKSSGSSSRGKRH